MWKNGTYKGTRTLECMPFPQHSKYEMLMLKQMGEGFLQVISMLDTSGVEVVPVP